MQRPAEEGGEGAEGRSAERGAIVLTSITRPIVRAFRRGDFELHSNKIINL